ncbi:tetratricopeptide repeat protein [Spongorhabdus nitratireducens]
MSEHHLRVVRAHCAVAVLIILTACSSAPKPVSPEPDIEDILQTAGVMKPAVTPLSHSLHCTGKSTRCYVDALKLLPAWTFPEPDQPLLLSEEQQEVMYRRFSDLMPIFEERAASGNQTAQLTLGLIRMRGQMAEPDPERGMKLLRQVADKGECLASWRLAANLFATNTDQAVFRLRQAAECSYQPAQVLLGLLYRDGKHVPVQYQQARYWLSLGAAQGSAEAAANLGLMQYYGIGGIQSEEQAINSWSLAALTGEPRAAYWLGLVESGRFQTDSLTKARQYFRQAIPAVVPAWNQLGILDLKVERSNDASEWFEAGAKAGDPLAAYNLGCLWHTGNGLTRNDLQAQGWLKQAAAQNLRQGQRLLGYLIWKESRGSADYMDAAELLEAAASQGDIYSLYLLGVMRATGQGLVRDLSQAYIRFSVAAAYGSPSASSMRDAVGRQLSSDELESAQRRAQFLYEKMLDRGAVLEAVSEPPKQLIEQQL